MQGDTLQRWRTEPFIMITGSGRYTNYFFPLYYVFDYCKIEKKEEHWWIVLFANVVYGLNGSLVIKCNLDKYNFLSADGFLPHYQYQKVLNMKRSLVPHMLEEEAGYFYCCIFN